MTPLRIHARSAGSSPLHGNQGDRHPAPAPDGPEGLAIAISREVGARGSSIAKRTARKLGWQVFTQEHLEYLCANDTARDQLLSDDSSHVHDWIENQLERLRTESSTVAEPEMGPLPRVLMTIAARGKAVVVGRGAGYLLPRESTLHVRIVAPLEDRVGFMAQALRLSQEEAEIAVRQREEQRSEFLLRHFGRSFLNATDYDLVLNSRRLGEEVCADLIAVALRSKRPRLRPEDHEAV